MAEEGEAGAGPGDPAQVGDEGAQLRGGPLGAAGGGDGGADRARRLVPQPGDDSGVGPGGRLRDELPVQRDGGGAEPAVGVEAGVGARDQDGDAVGPRQVAEYLGGQSGAPAVEGEEVSGRLGHRTVGRGTVTVAVVGGHPGRLGGVGPVGRVRLGQCGGRRRRRPGGERGRDPGLRGTGEREDHGTGDEGRTHGTAPPARMPPPTYRRTGPHGRSPPARPPIGPACKGSYESGRVTRVPPGNSPGG